MANSPTRARDASSDFVTRLVARYVDRYSWMDNQATEFFLRFAAAQSARAAVTARYFQSRGMDRTIGRYAVLRVLFFAPENKMALSDISSDMDVTASNITVLVDGLVKDGLVIRIPNPTDKRSTWVQLTREGGELCSHMVPGMATLNEELLKGFTEEEKIFLNDAMKRLKANAEAAFF